ncbi:MAG: SIS domain-containing protein [Chloroflexi bacterium]|nr:SIS domain-containing protein [Chloroflexota bacterium]
MTEKKAFELYLAEIQSMLKDVREKQKENILKAAEIIAQSVARGGILHVFGTSHSQLLAQEIFYRAGCLAPTNAMIEPTLGLRKASENCYWYERQEAYGKIILDSYHTTPGDVILIISTSGRNEVPVEVAIQAKARGLKVIALLSLLYCANVEARHSSGKKLPDVADVVLDNGAVLGDAAIELEGIPYKVGPTSGVIGAAILQALMVQVAQMLAERGVEPPIWVSVNVPGGAEINAKYLERYKDRIKHL